MSRREFHLTDIEPSPQSVFLSTIPPQPVTATNLNGEASELWKVSLYRNSGCKVLHDLSKNTKDDINPAIPLQQFDSAFNFSERLQLFRH